MKIKGIKYISPYYDNSGYAKAARHNILALHKLGVPLTLSPMSFELARPDLGEHNQLFEELTNKKIDYNFVVIHSTPEFYSRYREDAAVNVGYTIWETSKLHPSWKDYINKNVSGLMVGCEWNIDIFKDCGIEVPIFNVPHCIASDGLENCTAFDVKGVDKDTFMFYSVFQFTERKCPTALVKAYWTAFQANEDVALVLKTYRSDYSDPEKEAIRTTIKRLKLTMPMERFPPVYLILDMLSESEMDGLNKRGDCYVSLDRGEGFGLSPFQAGAAAKPIIVTGFGGVTEYAKVDNSYLVDYQLTPVFGMAWSPWYRGDQYWAEPSVKHGTDLMRHVYKNQEEAKARGIKLQRYIKENFSYEIIGNKIIEALTNS